MPIECKKMYYLRAILMMNQRLSLIDNLTWENDNKRLTKSNVCFIL